MIGLSLSFCVRDIASGYVDYRDVDKIIARTFVRNGDWSNIIKSYREGYDWGDEEEAVLNLLLHDGKIEQPRVTDNDYPHLSNTGCWVQDESEIEWEYRGKSEGVLGG